MNLPAISVPLTFTVQETSGAPVRTSGRPATFGVPLPKGVISGSEGWAVVAQGHRWPAQTKVLDRWPDGSVRWLLVDAWLALDGVGTIPGTLEVSGPPPVGAPQIEVIPESNGCEIDTGTARFALRTGLHFPFECRQADPQAGAAPEVTLMLSDAAGAQCVGRVLRVNVRDTGPIRARVDVSGRLDGSGPLSELEISATLDWYAGSSTCRAAVRIRNPRAAEHPGGFWDLGDRGSLLIKSATLRVALPGSGELPARCSPEPGAPFTKASVPFEIYQDSSGGENWDSPIHINRHRRIPTTFRGYRVRTGGNETTGLRANPIVTASRAGASVAGAVEHFWENFPKAIEVTPDAGLSLALFPSQFEDGHELQGGEQKTHVCFLAFGADAEGDNPLEWTRTGLCCAADPAWVTTTGAIPYLSDDQPDHRRLVWSAVDGEDTFARKREVVDEFGWRNFGDIYGDHEAIRHAGPKPLVSHYNNQYDPVAGFLYQFFRSGDPRWQSMAAELAGHVVDIDIYHTVRDKWSFNHGLFWHTYHYGEADTSTHRTYPKAGKGETHGGGPSPDHNYTTGLMLHYFLTGDDTARETAIDLAQCIIDADDGNQTIFKWLSRANTGFATASGSYDYHGPGRGPGNSLNSLIDGHRLTGETRFLDKAEQIIRRVVHPTEDVWTHRLDDPENKWFYLMFLQSLGKYLAYKAELGQVDAMYAYGRAALLNYARWMADHEYPYLEKPERLTFPTETWAAHEVRKSDVFYHAALHAAGDEREMFVERGTFFFRKAVDTLATMPTRTLARPVIVLLSSGLMHPWFQAVGAQKTLPAGTDAAFGERQVFIPQKQIAMKRAKLIVAAGGLLAVLAVGLAVYLFISSS